MKSAKKLFLLLSSITLLASCTGGGSSSSAPLFSSGDSSSEPTRTSLPFAPTDQSKAKAAFLDAFRKSATNDKVGLKGYVAADGEFSGKLAVEYKSDQQIPHLVSGKVHGKYDLSVYVSGLRNSAFSYAIEGNGYHEVEYGMEGQETFHNDYRGSPAAYAANGNAYFNFDEGFAEMFHAMSGYPYGAGKVYIKDAYTGQPSPLLPDEVIESAAIDLAEYIDEGLEQIGEYLQFLSYESTYRVEAKVTPATFLSIATRFADNQQVAMIFGTLANINITECVVSIDFDTKVGFQSVYLNVDADVNKTVAQLFPPETGWPDIIKDELVKGSLKAQIALNFEYGKAVPLPTDLSSYEVAKASSASNVPSPQPSKVTTVDFPEVFDMVSRQEDPHYNSVYTYTASTGNSEEFHEGQEQFDGYYNGLYHLTPQTIANMQSLAQQEGAKAFFYTLSGQDDLYFQVTVPNGQGTVTIDLCYPTFYDRLYAERVTLSIIEESGIGHKEEIYLKWFFSEPASTATEEESTYPEETSTSEESTSEPTDIVPLEEAEFLDVVAKASKTADYDHLEIGYADGKLDTYDTNSPEWPSIQNLFEFHLTSSNAQDFLTEVHNGAFYDPTYTLDYTQGVLRVGFASSDSTSSEYDTVTLEYDLTDGLYARILYTYHVVDGEKTLVNMAKLYWYVQQ